ncbi:hypothetical protein ACFVFS_23500 [Kitasatospora sp. NPDC057692]|uniref:hypothetical protein n=1 Tax=Kitasatospora sp. NPDC057692 TaxID=3346215 RepID=UPI003683F97E
MSTRALSKAVRRAAALTAVAALGLTGGLAEAAPLEDGGTVVTVGAEQPVALIAPDGGTAYVVVLDAARGIRVKAVDTRTGAVGGQVGLGTAEGRPRSALAADGTRLYVLNGADLSVVDTATLTVLSTTAAPDQPRPAGWVAGAPSGIAVSPDGATVYVAQDGPWQYKRRRDARLLAFSTAERAFTASVPLGAWLTGTPAIRPGTGDLYLGTSAGLLHLDASGGAPVVLRTVPDTVASTGYDLAFTPDGRRLLALDGGLSGRGDLVDPAADAVVRRITLTAPDTVVGLPRSASDGSRFYAVEDDPDQPLLHAYDTTTGEDVADETLPSPERKVTGLAVGPDGDALYLSGTTGDTARLHILPN